MFVVIVCVVKVDMIGGLNWKMGNVVVAKEMIAGLIKYIVTPVKSIAKGSLLLFQCAMLSNITFLLYNNHYF